MKVQSVYYRVCTRFLEPVGLQSGIFTLNDFLNHFTTVIEDFMERTGCIKIIMTGAVHFFISVYQVPDQISHADNMFISGRLLRRTSLEDLDNGIYQWSKKSGIPVSYHEDGLPIKKIEVYPKPNYEGQAIPTQGPGVIQPPETDDYMIVGKFHPTWRDFTLVGSQVPLDSDFHVKAVWTLDDDIGDLPDSAIPYLAWGVLGKMYGDDSEAKDEQRAKYCVSRYEEGVSIFRAITAERCFNDPDNSI